MTDTWKIIEHKPTGLKLPAPPGWLAVHDAGAPLVLAWPDRDGASQRFRPNLVASVEQPAPELADLDA